MTTPRPAPPVRKGRPAALAVALAVWAGLAAACGPAGTPPASAGAAPAGSTGEYVVAGSLDEVYGAVRVLVNGFPPVRLPTDGVIARYAPGTGLGTYATPALVSGENVAAVEVVPAVFGSPSGPAVGPVRFRAWVEAPDGTTVPGTERPAAHVDSVVAAWTAELGARWAGWSRGGGAAEDSARAWAQRRPVRVEMRFARPGGAADGAPSFDAVFRDAPVIAGTPADSARLRAYAVQLRDLTAARDTAALMAEFAPSVDARYRQSGAADSAAFYERNRQAFVLDDPAPFGAPDVGLRSWAGGRVWELTRPGARPLLSGPGGAVRAVYVGEGPDGALRVVR